MIFDMKKIVINVFLLAFVHNLHALNITKSYYVSVTSVESVIKTIKRYDTPNVQTCREGNKLIECDSEFQKHHEDRIIGYDVSFEIDGQVFVTRMKKDPGRFIKIKEIRKFIPLEEAR